MSALRIEFSGAVQNLRRACSELKFGDRLIVLNGHYFKDRQVGIDEIRGQHSHGLEQLATFLNEHYYGFRFGIKRAAHTSHNFRHMSNNLRDDVRILPGSPVELEKRLYQKTIYNTPDFFVYSDRRASEGRMKEYIAFRDPRLAF